MNADGQTSAAAKMVALADISTGSSQQNLIAGRMSPRVNECKNVAFGRVRD